MRPSQVILATSMHLEVCAFTGAFDPGDQFIREITVQWGGLNALPINQTIYLFWEKIKR